MVLVTGLNNLLKHRVVLKLERITWVHFLKIRHQFLKEGLSSFAIIISLGRGRVKHASDARVLENSV